jgi:hypothetical protein
VAEVHEIPFPALLEPVDDLAPATVITEVGRPTHGKVAVRGTTSDNGTVAKVIVNGQEARAVQPNFAEWEVVVDQGTGRSLTLAAHATDTAGNVEKRPHVVVVDPVR